VHAADSQRQADATADPALKRTYSDLADRWLFLLHVYRELQGFVNQSSQRKERTPVDPALLVVGQQSGLLPVVIYVCEPSGLIVYYNSHAAKLWGRSKLMGHELPQPWRNLPRPFAFETVIDAKRDERRRRPLRGRFLAPRRSDVGETFGSR
jgi:PAS domain-containing protein